MNNTISKNTLINNTIGIKLNNYYQSDPRYTTISSVNSTNNVFEYNRIVDNTYNLQSEYLNSTYGNATGLITNNSDNFNWWGLNNPEDSIFQNASAFNASYWFVTNLSSMQDSVNKSSPARFNYTIGLNDPTVLANPMNLPYFTFNVDSKTYDARQNQVLSKVYNEAGDKVYGFFVYNQWLEAKVKD
ncbi:hypothetical protein ALNOE001_01580 [Candidatus Methanobinarius endosymbioticus]|uniref:Uncharacterized protein n=1 Tax=Candidatus Methanobinarius endosymbioticus TaxID=2006182 RepID=A0A366MFA6_9EURY|nr:hypothetical protein ALNOE001_01580 [Candidatus Methanobinarius endosymbioticus]